MESTEDRIVTHLSRTRFDDLPPEAIEAARKCIIDTLGVIVAGNNGDDIDVLLNWLQGRNGPEEATVLVHGLRLPVVNATWANGAMARAREFDDSHDGCGEHISVPIMSAALATAEYQGKINGRQFLTAYVLAADLVARIRLARRATIGEMAFMANAHAPFSAAAVSALLLGLKGKSLYHALGWAYAQCAGAVQLQQGGGSALHIHHGLAAATGVQAALLARQGLPGTEDFLTGKFGLYNSYDKCSYDADVLMGGLGTQFEITNVAQKQYPCGRVIHPPVEAAILLYQEERVKPEEIIGIEVVYSKGGHKMTCEPEEERRAPTRVQHAKFSLYYNIACALAHGHVNLEDFTVEALADETVRTLAPKITVKIDPDMRGMLPGIVTVMLKDGRSLRREITRLKGSVENQMSYDECSAKFRYCASSAAKRLNQGKVDAAVDLIARLEELEDMRELVRLVV